MVVPWPPYDVLQALPGVPSRPTLFACRACGARAATVNAVLHETSCAVGSFERSHHYDGNILEVV